MTRHDWKPVPFSRSLVSAALSFLMIASGLAACTGTVVDAPGGARGPGGPGGGSMSPGGGSAPGGGGNNGPGPMGGILPPAPPPGPDGKACETAIATPARVWRLSDDQFSNAVNDLIGVRPADISTTGRDKSQFVDFAERFHIDPALTTDIRNSVEAVAKTAVADLPKLTGCPQNQAADACADSFIDRFGARAFRRPLEASEKQALKALYTAGAVDGPAEGFRVLVMGVLQAPSFLYRTELGKPGAVTDGKPVELTAHELASSLSFLLLHSIPDTDLTAAANDGSLLNNDVFKRQVERLMGLPRVQENLTRMMLKWVGLGNGINVELQDVVKEFTPELKGSLEQEVSLFFKGLLTKGGTIGDVLTSNKGYIDTRLAALYGMPAPAASAGFQEVTYPAAERSGILTQAGILARYSMHHSLIFRGKYVRDELLCGEIPSPPPDPAIDQENMASATLSEREQSERRLAHGTCGACHRQMDTIGFGFLKYDPLARFQAAQNGQAVDDSGEILDGGDVTGTFANFGDLARKLANSKRVRSCISEKVFQYALGRLYNEDSDRCELQRIDAHLQQNGNKLSELISGVIYSSAFRYRTGGN